MFLIQETKKEVDLSSNDIKKVKNTVFKGSKSDNQKLNTSGLSNSSVSIESCISSKIVKKVSPPTKFHQAQHLIVKKSNNTSPRKSSNVCFICSKKELKKSLISCLTCETKSNYIY